MGPPAGVGRALVRRKIGSSKIDAGALMDQAKSFIKSELIIALIILIAVSALSYLPLISKFGYYNDDWYEIYSANVRGPMVFQDIYSIDRPVRLLVMAPAYALFGGN